MAHTPRLVRPELNGFQVAPLSSLCRIPLPLVPANILPEVSGSNASALTEVPDKLMSVQVVPPLVLRYRPPKVAANTMLGFPGLKLISSTKLLLNTRDQLLPPSVVRKTPPPKIVPANIVVGVLGWMASVHTFLFERPLFMAVQEPPPVVLL